MGNISVDPLFVDIASGIIAYKMDLPVLMQELIKKYLSMAVHPIWDIGIPRSLCARST